MRFVGGRLLKCLFSKPLAGHSRPAHGGAGDVFNEVRCHQGPCQVLGKCFVVQMS